MAEGSCLCGGVRYTVTGPLRDVWQCHCRRCQKSTGNFMAATACPLADLSIGDGATLSWFSPPDDPGVAYGFCDRCGSSLFWKAQSGDSISICAGTLDEAEPLTTTAAWFSDEVASHTSLPPGIELIPRSDTA